jgi:hypothetical protein
VLTFDIGYDLHANVPSLEAQTSGREEEAQLNYLKRSSSSNDEDERACHESTH